MTTMRAGILLLIGLVVVIGAVKVGTDLLQPQPGKPISLARPHAGEVRADHLPDGTPVWVIGHEDGSASVLSGFDTHTPFNIGKLLWWCNSAQTLDNPHHGSHWDQYGRRIDGPAPADLPSWEVLIQGDRIVLGDRRASPPVAMPAGPPAHEREHCFGDDAEVIVHTFDGWKLWDSPRAAIEAGPEGWILIDGTLEADLAGGRVLLCSPGGCADAAVALAVDIPDIGPEFSPLGPGRFIAQVRDGALANLTRVVLLGRE